MLRPVNCSVSRVSGGVSSTNTEGFSSAAPVGGGEVQRTPLSSPCGLSCGSQRPRPGLRPHVVTKQETVHKDPHLFIWVKHGSQWGIISFFFLFKGGGGAASSGDLRNCSFGDLSLSNDRMEDAQFLNRFIFLFFLIWWPTVRSCDEPLFAPRSSVQHPQTVEDHVPAAGWLHRSPGGHFCWFVTVIFYIITNRLHATTSWAPLNPASAIQRWLIATVAACSFNIQWSLFRNEPWGTVTPAVEP